MQDLIMNLTSKYKSLKGRLYFTHTYTDRELPMVCPYYLGFAYRLPHLRSSVFAPIPLNYIIGWTRNLWFKLMQGPRDRLSDAMDAQYAMEHQEGYRRGLTDGLKGAASVAREAYDRLFIVEDEG